MNKETLKQIRNPIINLVCLVLILILYFLDKVLNLLFFRWLVIVGFSVGVILAICHIVFNQLKKDKVTKAFKIINEYMQILLVALLIVEIIFSFIMFPATVQQTSMLPTLTPGEKLVVRKTKNIDNNDIIVFEYDSSIQRESVGVYDNDLLIKRVIAKPGQSFYYKDNKLYINDVEAKDDFVVSELNGLTLKEISEKNGLSDICLTEEGKYVLPDGYYVVFGDNRQYVSGKLVPVSIDSRTFGLIHESQIYGRVDYIMESIIDWNKI